jgi:hypothetical protein
MPPPLWNGHSLLTRMPRESSIPAAPPESAAGMDSPGPRLSSGAWVALVALGVYLLLPTRDFYWDGVGFAQAIETSHGSPDTLLHPNHLLYNLMGYAAWRVAVTAGMAIRALYVLQALNGLFAAASVYLVWRIVAELTQSARRSVWFALLFAFAAQWWRFAADANAYVPSIFFLLLSFRFLLPPRHPRPWAAGLAHSAAMLFHQLAFFFFPVAIAGFLYRPRLKNGENASRGGVSLVAKYCAISIPITAAAYLGAYALVRPYIGGRHFWDWITVRSEDASFTFELARNLRYAVRGTLRLFFGGRVNQVQPDIVVVAGMLAFGTSLALVVRYFVRVRRLSAGECAKTSPYSFYTWLAVSLPGFVWILIYMVFLFIWLPQNTFYRLFYWAPLVFLLSTLPFRREHRVQLLALLAAIVCFWNFTVSIYPHSKTGANEVLTFALQHRQDWPQGSLILYGNSHSDLWLISYFNPQASWINIPSPQRDQVENLRQEAARNGQSFWLEGTGYDSLAAAPGGQSWLEEHIDRPHSLLYTTPAHRIRYYRIK